MNVIQTSKNVLAQGKIMKDTAGTGRKLKLVKMKLDNLRYVKSECVIINDYKRLNGRIKYH